MAKWIEYTGSDEQYSEIINSRNGFMLRDKFSKVASPIFRKLGSNMVLSGTEYLICDPHPYADEIKIWADTGCEVFIKSKYGLVLIVPTGSNYDLVKICNGYSIYKSCAPDWNIPGAEYRLTPFED